MKFVSFDVFETTFSNDGVICDIILLLFLVSSKFISRFFFCEKSQNDEVLHNYCCMFCGNVGCFDILWNILTNKIIDFSFKHLYMYRFHYSWIQVLVEHSSALHTYTL